MANLDDIPKKTFFTTPENYFDKLPGRIQSRITEADTGARRNRVVTYALQYALPIIVVFALVLFYRSSNPDAETILATVDTEELIIYLQESGMTTEELLDNVEFTQEELEAIENEIYDPGLLDREPESLDL
jgi:hypothetical protein